MQKLIRIFSYFLMILGAVILVGGLSTGILMLVTRGGRMMEQSWPMMRMMGPGSAFTTGLKVMLEGLLVSGFGMLLYLLGENVKPKSLPVTTVPEKKSVVKK
jgi:hypothetical protein